jgi:hypothetical protein
MPGIAVKDSDDEQTTPAGGTVFYTKYPNLKLTL